MIRIGKITGFTLIIPRFRPFANGYILIFLRFGLLALPLRQVLIQRKKYAKVNTRKIKICGDAGMIEIRYVQAKDKAFWYGLDKHLPEHEFYNKIREKQGYVLLVDNQPVGLLRYHLFWDNTPFCAMLFIEPHNQKKGYGKLLMEHWEKDMKAQGYGMLLLSTQADEEAQHFYRKLGYKDCGGFVIDVKGYEQPMELFFIKGI